MTDNDKPAIPEDVADIIKTCKSYKSLYWVINNLYEIPLISVDACNWVRDNTAEFAKAWENGYNISEPLYIVKFAERNDGLWYILYQEFDDGDLRIKITEPNDTHSLSAKTWFTHDEVYDINPDYLHFIYQVSERILSPDGKKIIDKKSYDKKSYDKNSKDSTSKEKDKVVIPEKVAHLINFKCDSIDDVFMYAWSWKSEYEDYTDRYKTAEWVLNNEDIVRKAWNEGFEVGEE